MTAKFDQIDLTRTAVVGTSCSGKTTFARQLAEQLGTSHVELDALFWLPDWQIRPKDEFRELVRQKIADSRWIVDGNYSPVRDLIWPRATAVVWLDYSFRVVFSRAFRRTLRRSVTREELFSGNRESWRRSFLSRESILLWVMETWRKNRHAHGRLVEEAGAKHLDVVRLRDPAASKQFLSSIRPA